MSQPELVRPHDLGIGGETAYSNRTERTCLTASGRGNTGVADSLRTQSGEGRGYARYALGLVAGLRSR